MELTNDFRVAIPPATAWGVLTDVERIAPCMPGAQLQEVHGEEYRGVVKVKVGPITAQYKGAATFVERDDANLKAVLRAEGRDTRGQGNASATITATLSPDGDGTHVTVVTDLHVTGKVAQFGRGVMADVSSKLLGQFVECLETTVLAGEAKAAGAAPDAGPATTAGEATGAGPATWEAPAAPAASNTPPEVASSAPRKIDSPEAKPVDLIDTAGGSVAKRAAPVLAVLAVLWLLRVLLKRRKK
jgi:carbon monoxide dehydrogenase subunit G